MVSVAGTEGGLADVAITVLSSKKAFVCGSDAGSGAVVGNCYHMSLAGDMSNDTIVANLAGEVCLKQVNSTNASKIMRCTAESSTKGSCNVLLLGATSHEVMPVPLETGNHSVVIPPGVTRGPNFVFSEDGALGDLAMERLSDERVIVCYIVSQGSEARIMCNLLLVDDLTITKASAFSDFESDRENEPGHLDVARLADDSVMLCFLYVTSGGNCAVVELFGEKFTRGEHVMLTSDPSWDLSLAPVEAGDRVVACYGRGVNTSEAICNGLAVSNMVVTKGPDLTVHAVVPGRKTIKTFAVGSLDDEEVVACYVLQGILTRSLCRALRVNAADLLMGKVAEFTTLLRSGSAPVTVTNSTRLAVEGLGGTDALFCSKDVGSQTSCAVLERIPLPSMEGVVLESWTAIRRTTSTTSGFLDFLPDAPDLGQISPDLNVSANEVVGDLNVSLALIKKVPFLDDPDLPGSLSGDQASSIENVAGELGGTVPAVFSVGLLVLMLMFLVCFLCIFVACACWFRIALRHKRQSDRPRRSAPAYQPVPGFGRR